MPLNSFWYQHVYWYLACVFQLVCDSRTGSQYVGFLLPGGHDSHYYLFSHLMMHFSVRTILFWMKGWSWNPHWKSVAETSFGLVWGTIQSFAGILRKDLENLSKMFALAEIWTGCFQNTSWKHCQLGQLIWGHLCSFFGVLWKINVKNTCVYFHVVIEGSKKKAGLWFDDLCKIYLAWLHNNNNKGLYCQNLKLIQIMLWSIACPVYSVIVIVIYFIFK